MGDRSAAGTDTEDAEFGIELERSSVADRCAKGCSRLLNAGGEEQRAKSVAPR